MSIEEKEQFKSQGTGQGLDAWLVSDVVQTVEEIFEQLKASNKGLPLSKGIAEFQSEKEMIEFLFDKAKIMATNK
ncbi:hypothetical protein GGR92_003655 [Spirosoma lacussanchae]|uniref:hypothetical protein n=1 Tax=Spirosoma lacussanchae TaxID=1884249 RepID=UPI0011090917|nr:hypothetical protein [Spirosoma lacussanchae]